MRRKERTRRFDVLEQRVLMDATPLVTEVMNVALSPTDDELLTVPGAIASDFDYLELWNPSDVDSVDLNGWQLSGSANFTFPDQTLAPESFAIITANAAAFEARYGDSLPVVGSFESGELSADIVTIEIHDADENVIADFQTGGHELWAGRNQLAGTALEPASLEAVTNEQLARPSGWRAGPKISGTPGIEAVDASGVWINEIDAASDNSSGVELFNSSQSAIDVSGWFVSNSGNDLQKFAIPEETTIAAGEFLVLAESDLNPDPDNPLPKHFSITDSGPGKLWLSRFDSGVGFVEDVAEYLT
ncbi:lamin tail domain-containing protein, partial [Planctomycetota bacterium]